jgi:protein-tyrosine phosphatase
MDRFSIVFVCTGNRFRSPVAEAFVRRLTLGLGIDVGSCGVLNLDSSPALPEAIEIGMWYGVDLSQHRTKWLQDVALADTDLVVAFQRSHLRDAVVEASARRERSFLFRELVGLLQEGQPPTSGDAVSHARTAIAEAADRRSEATARSDLSMPDPFGSTWKTYRRTAEEIHSLAIALTSALFGVSNSGLPSTSDLPPRRRLWRRVRF